MTGGRLNRIKEYVVQDPAFCVTYGDGLSNINFDQLINQHNKSKAIVTLTAVHPPARFGSLELDGSNVFGFKEKPKGDGAMINGGFFVMSPEVFNYFKSDRLRKNQQIKFLSLVISKSEGVAFGISKR